MGDTGNSGFPSTTFPTIEPPYILYQFVWEMGTFLGISGQTT
jgi:hypothetical protein